MFPSLTVGLMEHHPFCFRMSRSSVEEMDGPNHVAGKRSSETLDWRIRDAINARKEKHLKNHRGEGVIVQSEVDPPESPLPSPPLLKMFNPFELPDRYKTLNNLFAEMECSIRWLALQNQLPLFQNICTQMKRQTNKKFLISHLAQMKHIFPEAIDLKTVLAHHDKRTLCMKPEIKVTLLMNARTCSMFPAHSPSQSLWQAFRTKLLEFSLARPEGGEIPEAVLPYPFNRESYDARYNDSSAEESVAENPEIPTEELVMKDDKSPRETPLTPSFSKSSVFSRLFREANVPDLVFCETEQKFFWEKDISNHPPSKPQLREETDADAIGSNSDYRGPRFWLISGSNSDDRGPRFNREFLN